jgi:DNA-directed RNA polymerase subunit M/transcription elongation factor TFIIS
MEVTESTTTKAPVRGKGRGKTITRTKAPNKKFVEARIAEARIADALIEAATEDPIAARDEKILTDLLKKQAKSAPKPKAAAKPKAATKPKATAKPSATSARQPKGVKTTAKTKTAAKPSAIQPEDEDEVDARAQGIAMLRDTMESWNGTESEVERLSELTYKDTSEYIISTEYPQLMMEVIGLIRRESATFAIDFLAEAPNPEYVIWEQPVFDTARQNLAREILMYTEGEKGVKGAGKCRYCTSKELVFSSKQMTSGDEQTKIFVKCVLCLRGWRVN